jgi:hypothetical protein
MPSLEIDSLDDWARRASHRCGRKAIKLEDCKPGEVNRKRRIGGCVG